MKFTVLQENLSNSLGSSIRMISSRPQLPVLSNLLINARNDGLYISGTDLEMGVVIKTGAKVESQGKVTVPAKMFAEFVSALPAGKVDIELMGETLYVKTDSYKAEFQTIGADEYPELPSFEEREGALEVKGEAFISAIESVLYAVAKDSMRPVLTGVLFEFGKKGFRLAATDGFRLAVKDVREVSGELEGGSYVVPSRAISEVQRVIKNDTIHIKFLKESNQAIFLGGDSLVVTQLLDGNYPEYRKIIPDEFNTTLSVSRVELLEALSVSQVFARENSNVLQWKIRDQEIGILSESPERGKNESKVMAIVDGEGGEIAFNGRFIIEYLQTSNSEKIKIGMNESLSPGEFRDEGDESFLYIVMPINL